MSLKIYNSLTNKIEDFHPLHDNVVNMYVCGPTVYNKIHIGNARPVVFFDMLKRYLTYRGYKVNYASNITDVDDKIINGALACGKNEKEYADYYASIYLKNVKELGCNYPDYIPYATDYIPNMISFIGKLIEKGYAYESDGNVFFRVSKVSDYGKLSKQKLDMLDAGSRIEVNDKKESPYDFALWKKTDKGIKWQSSFGEGRPGWHTECVCMIDDIFKGEIDIHGGGYDLRFPHHENEIAQYEAFYHQDLSKYFMHVGRLNFNGEKMSKSLGNVILVDDLKEKALPLRLLILMQNYRNQINFTDELFNDFLKDYEKIKRTYLQASLYLDLALNEVKDKDEDSIKSFIEYMDDDFNTPNVYTLILQLVKDINISLRSKNSDQLVLKYNALKEILEVLGINFDYHKLSKEDRKIYSDWQKARECKDFNLADELRSELTKRGIL